MRTVSRRVHQLAVIAILAAVYVATAHAGLTIHAATGAGSLIWAPSGIGLAAVLLFGNWAALGVAIGAFVTVLLGGQAPLPALGIAVWDAFEALVGAYVLRVLLGFRPALDRVRDVIALVVVVVAITAASATASTGVLVLAGVLPPERFEPVWSNWWWGHLAGDLIVTPLAITWSTSAPGHGLGRRTSVPEVVALTALMFLVGAYVFYGWFPEWLPGARMPYFLVPLLLWAGLRCRPRGASVTNFAVSMMAIFATAAGLGPFAQMPHYLQMFISISTVMTLTLAALQMERLYAVQRKGAILEGALDAIITIDAGARIVELNRAAERLFGVRESTAIGRDVATLIVPPSLRAFFRESLASYLQTGVSELLGRRVRFTLQRADGSEFPAEIAATRVPIEDQYLFTGFVRDITLERDAEIALRESHELLERKVSERTAELRRANTELQRSEELLRYAQELAHLGSYERDVDTGRIAWSDELYRIYGRDPATFDPTTGFLRCVHPDDRARLHSIIESSLHSHEPFSFEMRIVRPGGEVRFLHSRGKVYVDETGRPRRMAGYSQDITERKRAEEARFRLGEIVESSHDAIIGLALDGRIETWNAAAERTFGYSAAEAVGRPAAMLVPPDRAPDLERFLAAVRSGQHVDHYELVHARRDGTVFDASVTLSAIVDQHGRVISMAKVLRDISDQKAAEKKLRAALREKDVLLREIHHRVKNNLQVISSLLNLQVAKVPSDEARKGLVESQSRIQSMALVHQLLYQSKDLAHIDLHEYLQGLVQRLVKSYQVQPVEVTVNAPTIMLDIDRAIPCGLIVTELVTNSLGHAFPGGRAGRIRVELAHAGDQLVLEVRDDGVGLPPGLDLDTLPSFGLQIARTLARQLAGSLELATEGGTIARVVFPAVPP